MGAVPGQSGRCAEAALVIHVRTGLVLPWVLETPAECLGKRSGVKSAWQRCMVSGDVEKSWLYFENKLLVSKQV